jgi:hypothetical protein
MDIPVTSKYYRIISMSFEPFLWHYVQKEDENLVATFRELTTAPPTAGQEGIFTSASDLFISFRQIMVNCSRLSTRKPFLDMYEMFARWLNQYQKFLIHLLPK